MTIWIITDKQGKYICAFKNQEDAGKMYSNHKNRYEMYQSSLS